MCIRDRLYSNILLKLYLKSLKHGGRLQLDEDIPYTAQMIATITRQQIGTVERALQIFLKLGLVEVLDSGTFYMSNIELLIGQSSTCLLYTSPMEPEHRVSMARTLSPVPRPTTPFRFSQKSLNGGRTDGSYHQL